MQKANVSEKKCIQTQVRYLIETKSKIEEIQGKQKQKYKV